MKACLKEWDVAIVGGGMVGASFALALRATKLRVLLIESIPPDSATQPSFDERTTALGNGSRQIFESLGVWQAMSAESAAIRSIHVSDAGRFGVARLEAREQGVPAFGYVVPNRVIGRVLWQALRESSNVTLAMPAQLKSATLRDDGVLLDLVQDGKPEQIRAAVAVAADGAGSVLRASAGIKADVEDYDQVAIVVNAATERPNNGQAFERFTSSGPLAVLPVTGGGYAVIWAVAPARAAELMALDEAAFAAELLNAFGWRAGRWTRIGRRNTYPLALSRAARDRRGPRGAHRQCRAGTASGGGPGIQSRAARCGNARGNAGEGRAGRRFLAHGGRIVRQVRRLARRGPQRRHAIHRQPRETVRQPCTRAFRWCAISVCCCST